MADALLEDISAVILIGGEPTLTDFASPVEPFGGKIIQTDTRTTQYEAVPYKWPVPDPVWQKIFVAARGTMNL